MESACQSSNQTKKHIVNIRSVQLESNKQLHYQTAQLHTSW